MITTAKNIKCSGIFRVFVNNLENIRYILDQYEFVIILLSKIWLKKGVNFFHKGYNINRINKNDEYEGIATITKEFLDEIVIDNSLIPDKCHVQLKKLNNSNLYIQTLMGRYGVTF